MPTGVPHIGTARTAYFNWLAARASGGKFLLRIDDTDRQRSEERYVDAILDMMQWLGLESDDLWFQSQRENQYASWIVRLASRGKAYAEDDAYRLRLSEINLPDSWRDELAGDIPITERDRSIIDGMVLMKSGAHPTYHFASVVDDVLYDIDTIIRGADHISNTAKQVAIYTAMAYPLPRFYHVGLIHKDKKKLSKRDADSSVLTYREVGYDPDAVLNFMLRMGWGPTKEDKSTSLINREQALELFWAGGKMRSAPSGFDQDKLDSFHRKYQARKRMS